MRAKSANNPDTNPDSWFMAPTLSPKFAAYVYDYLIDVGEDPGLVLERSPLSYATMEDGDAPLPLTLVADMFEQAQNHCNHAHIGLKMVERYHYESAGIIVLMVLASPNVGAAVKTLCRYDKKIDLAIQTWFESDKVNSVFSLDLLNPEEIDVQNLNEFLAALFVDILRKGTRMAVPLKAISFQHSRKENDLELEQFFACPIKFNQPLNQVVFNSSFLGQQFRTANELLYDTLVDTVDNFMTLPTRHGGILADLCTRIFYRPNNQSPTIDEVAGELAMSSRTLRRRLEDEGLSFQEVKRLAREQMAKSMLANSPKSLSEISFRLGYSQLSVFSRAFRSWVGVPPAEFRQKYRAQRANKPS